MAATALNPNFTWMHLFRAWSHEAPVNFTAAITGLKMAVELGDSGGMATAEPAYALARNGRRNEAIAALEQAADKHSPMIVFIRAEPVFVPKRRDPRFQALIKRLRF